MEEVALCPNCNNKIGVLGKNCSNQRCDSEKYEILFRSIQVKSSHLVDNGKNIGFNFKFQDLIDDDRHFFIVYNMRIINGIERHFYWVLTENDFKKIKNVNTTAFKIYQNDRGHYPSKSLEEYRFNEEEFYKLEEERWKAYNEKRIEDFKKLSQKQKDIDVFRKLD